MTKVYAVYGWIAKRVRDQQFLSVWQSFAKWRVKQEGLTGSHRLFKDLFDPAHYVSDDSGQDETDFETIRSGVDFGRQHALQQLSQNFASWTLKLESDEPAKSTHPE